MPKIDENIKQFIAPTWFGDESELVIKVEEGFDKHDRCVISLSQKYRNDALPQHPFFTCIYINGVLNINSSFGNGVFNWYNPKNSVEWMAHLRSEGYIIEKCLASSDNLGKYKHFSSYDSDLAVQEYKEFIEEYKRDLEEGDFRWDLKFPELDLDSYESMLTSVSVDLSNYLSEHDEFYDVFDLNQFGIKVSSSFQKIWAWFNIAVNLANEKGLLNGFHESK